MPGSRASSVELLTPLRLVTLGGAALVRQPGAGQSAHLLGPGKPLALLVYLAFSPGRSASREHLIDLLWSDLEPERGKHALRQTIYFLRHQLGEQSLLGRQGELHLAIPVVTDRDAFTQAIESGELDRAVELYTGAFLPGFASPGGAEFEQWADLERERLRGIFVRAAESLARRHLSRSSFRDAQRLARRVRDEDPLNESNWRLLIETLVSANDHLAAAIEADALTTLLKAEGREPEPATRAALRLARQRPQEGEPPPGGRGLMAELIGREREFATVVRAWEAARRGTARHIYVSAPAGLGKTRLLNDVHGRLRASGACVVHLRANPGDRRISYLLAGELIGAVAALPGAVGISPAAASSLIALHPGLSARFSGAMDQSTGDEALRRRTMATSEILGAVADESPLALLIDDVHWMDPASQQLLLGVLDRLQSGRILVVTTARPTRDDAIGAAASDRLTLEPLSVVQVGALLASLGALPREDWTESLTVALHGTSGGSPLLVIETLQLALDRGSLVLGPKGWQCQDPIYLITELQAGGALRHRISQLDPESHRILVLLAAAGTPITLRQIAAAAESSPERVEHDLSNLERRGFAVRAGNEWEPAHDQIAEISLEASPAPTVRAAQTALGRALAADSVAEPRLLPRAAHHLEAGGAGHELARLYARWFEAARARGDRRSPVVLASELLGGTASPERAVALARTLPFRQRARYLPSRPMIAAAAALLVVDVAAISALYWPEDPPPAAALLAIAPTEADSISVVQIPMDRDMISDDRPVEIMNGTRDPEVVRLPGWSQMVGQPHPSPDARRWVYAMTTGDTGVVELFLHDAGGNHRLTYAPGEDLDPTWAPDSRLIAFATSRWAEPRQDAADLAIVDPERRIVRQITGGDSYDFSPRWSGDGTRIAFVRRHHDLRANELCWVTPDGATLECMTPPEYEATRVLGWRGQSQVIALADAGDEQALVLIDLERGTAVPIEQGSVSQAAASYDGDWTACFCQRGSDPAPVWYVYQTDAPDQAKRVLAGDGLSPPLLGWQRPDRPSRHLATLRLLSPAAGIPLAATHRLRIAAADSSGSAIDVPAPVLRWRSATPDVAEVDSLSGVVHPRRPGTARIVVSAGGWRQDSIAVRIRPANPERRLSENWTTGLDRWHTFGHPAPRIVTGSDGVPALWNAGDGSFPSGAYTRATFAAERGLGVAVQLSTPVHRRQWQTVTLALTADLDSATLAAWDHEVGNPPLRRAAGRGSCSLSYPGGAGTAALQRFELRAAGGERRRPAPPDTPSGEWYTVVAQVFPDGTCGFAVNGIPLWRSESSVALDRPFRVELAGKSVDTRILVGPVEVWEGVRAGVDWGR